jgi:hypothetical protein
MQSLNPANHRTYVERCTFYADSVPNFSLVFSAYYYTIGVYYNDVVVFDGLGYTDFKHTDYVILNPTEEELKLKKKIIDQIIERESYPQSLSKKLLTPGTIFIGNGYKPYLYVGEIESIRVEILGVRVNRNITYPTSDKRYGYIELYRDTLYIPRLPEEDITKELLINNTNFIDSVKSYKTKMTMKHIIKQIEMPKQKCFVQENTSAVYDAPNYQIPRTNRTTIVLR